MTAEEFNQCSPEEQAAMSNLVADMRQRRQVEQREREECAAAKERFCAFHRRMVASGRIAPENAEEREIWRQGQGFDYRDGRDLKR